MSAFLDGAKGTLRRRDPSKARRACCPVKEIGLPPTQGSTPLLRDEKQPVEKGTREPDFTDLFLKNKNKRLKKSFISNPAWGCEWGIERAEKGAPPLPRESPALPPGASEGRAGQRQALALPALPPPQVAQIASKFERQRSVEAGGPRLPSSRQRHPGSSLPSDALWAPTLGLPGQPTAAPLMPSVAQQGSRGTSQRGEDSGDRVPTLRRKAV